VNERKVLVSATKKVERKQQIQILDNLKYIWIVAAHNKTLIFEELIAYFEV